METIDNEVADMRYFFLVSYDISNDKRLKKVFKVLNSFGDPIQYSVFLCQLTEKDLIILKYQLKDVINHSEDQILFIKLIKSDGKSKRIEEKIDSLGCKFIFRDRRKMIY